MALGYAAIYQSVPIIDSTSVYAMSRFRATALNATDS